MAMENVKTTKKSSLGEFLYVTGIIVVSVILIVLAMPNTEKPRLTYTLNEPWMNPQLISPGEILIQKDMRQVELEQREALQNEYVPYYSFDPSIGRRQVGRFTEKYGQGVEGVSAYCIQVIAEEMQKEYDAVPVL